MPLARVYGVAMFYSSFRLSPKGQHEVTLCMGTVCYLKGAPKISEAICAEYGIKPGGTTADRLFTLQAVNCVGACALAPVMVVDGKYYDGVTPGLGADRCCAAWLPARKPAGKAAAAEFAGGGRLAVQSRRAARCTEPAASAESCGAAASPSPSRLPGQASRRRRRPAAKAGRQAQRPGQSRQAPSPSRPAKRQTQSGRQGQSQPRSRPPRPRPSRPPRKGAARDR